MTAPVISRPSVRNMTGLLTRPYRRGSETLELNLTTDTGGWTPVASYGFGEYQARHGAPPPRPRYVLYLKQDSLADDMEVEVEWSLGTGATASGRIPVPGGTLQGMSFVIPTPNTAGHALRISRLRQLPLPLPGPGVANWGITALLGNIAQLLWVLGWEKDATRAALLQAQRQRHRSTASAHGLDLLGQDLRVPRFPPAEYSYDPDVVALYHLNEVVAATGTVLDDTKRFGVAGHDGTNNGAESGVAGKFGQGFRFPGPSGSADIIVPNAPDFAVAVSGELTVEAFVRTDPVESPTPRIVIMKRAQEQLAPSTSAGWALSLGSFRGIPNNVMWSIADGSVEIKAFADLDLADGGFHHVAAVLDRAGARVRLFVDGEQRMAVPTGALGAVSTSHPVRLGRSAAGNQFIGVLDEVRISRVARGEFHPVLGESDSAYRRRLGVFQRWQLPTPGQLLETINGLVRINGDPQSFTLVEQDQRGATATGAVRILPAAITAGQSIDREGRMMVSEDSAAGRPESDTAFAAIYLMRHDRPAAVDYTSEDARLMQASTAMALDELVDQLTGGGKLKVLKSYDPAGSGLHRVGRALRLQHSTATTNAIALAAHRAGFDYVLNEGSAVYTSVSLGGKLEIVLEPRAPNDTPPVDLDLIVGSVVDLHAQPEPLPSAGTYAWTLVPCGPGRAYFKPHPSDSTTLNTPVSSRPHLRLVAQTPGVVTVRVEYAYRGQTVSGTRQLRIGIADLGDNGTISASGIIGIREEDAVGKPGEIVDPRYLVRHDKPGVNYGTDPNNRLMQLPVERALNRLLDLLAADGVGAGLTITKAYDANDPGLHSAGRAVRFELTGGVQPGPLGAVAHRAGFGYVRRTGATIYASVPPGEKIEIAESPGLTPLRDELVTGTPIKLRARFTTLPPVNSGSYHWSVDPLGPARGSFDFLLRPQVTFTPSAPGLLLLSLAYLEADPQRTAPYTFEIRLKPSLDQPSTVISKPQYDLIMNILNYFHPIGVEVGTRNIREHVVEVKENLLNAFPGYTYPDFREASAGSTPHRAPGARRSSDDG